MKVLSRAGAAWTLMCFVCLPNAFASDVSISGPYAEVLTEASYSGSAAMTDRTLVVGSYEPADGSTVYGNLTVYERSPSNTWSKTFIAADLDSFNSPDCVSVSVSGDEIALGTLSPKSGRGGAWIYRKSPSGWQRDTFLVSSDYGAHVAVSGDLAVVGTYLESSQAGSAYVFRRSAGGWGFEAKISANDAIAGNEFGIGVAVDGETIAIGSLDGVYLFDHGTGLWKQKQKLSAIQPGETFGISIALKGSTLAVASPATSTSSGSHDNAYTYLFDGTSWSLESSFTYPPTAYFMQVALSSKRLVISQALMEMVNVYVKTRSGWSPEADFVASSTRTFGCAVAIGESFVAATECNSSPDAVHVFENLDEIFPNSFE